MLKSLSYRQKLRYLGIGMLLVLLICYRFAFSKTLQEYRQYRNMQRSGQATNGTETNYQLLLSKDRMLGNILQRYLLDTSDQTKNLLAVTGNMCREYGLALMEYKPYPVALNDSVTIQTRSITVGGDFVNCLKLQYYLETQTTVGRLSSVTYKTATLQPGAESILTCTFFIQNLIPDTYAKP